MNRRDILALPFAAILPLESEGQKVQTIRIEGISPQSLFTERQLRELIEHIQSAARR